MSKLLLPLGFLLLLSPAAFAEDNPVDDAAKTVNDAGVAVSNGIAEQTQWVGKTVDDFLTDPAEPPPPTVKKRHHFSHKS